MCANTGSARHCHKRSRSSPGEVDGHDEKPRQRQIKAMLKSGEPGAKVVGARLCAEMLLPEETVREWLDSASWEYVLAGVYSLVHTELPDSLLLLAIESGYLGDSRIRKALEEVCKKREIPLDIIWFLISSHKWTVRQVGVAACCNQSVPLEWLYMLLKDVDNNVRKGVPEAFYGKRVPIGVIGSWLERPSLTYKKAAIYALMGKEDIPIELHRKMQESLAALDLKETG